MTAPEELLRIGPYVATLNPKFQSKQPGEKGVLSVRISAAAKANLEQAVEIGPYRLTITAVIERGLELALRELKELKEHSKGLKL
jgi:hypothetical protein